MVNFKKEIGQVLEDIIGKDVSSIIHKFLTFKCPQCKMIYYNESPLIDCNRENCKRKFCIKCIVIKNCQCEFCSADFIYCCEKCYT